MIFNFLILNKDFTDAPQFNHVQQIAVKVNPSSLDYLKKLPIAFEVFGHFLESSLLDGSDSTLSHDRKKKTFFFLFFFFLEFYSLINK